MSPNCTECGYSEDDCKCHLIYEGRTDQAPDEFSELTEEEKEEFDTWIDDVFLADLDVQELI